MKVKDGTVGEKNERKLVGCGRVTFQQRLTRSCEKSQVLSSAQVYTKFLGRRHVLLLSSPPDSDPLQTSKRSQLVEKQVLSQLLVQIRRPTVRGPLSRGHAPGRYLLLSPTLTSTPTRLNYSQFGHGGDILSIQHRQPTPSPVSNNLS